MKAIKDPTVDQKNKKKAKSTVWLKRWKIKSSVNVSSKSLKKTKTQGKLENVTQCTEGKFGYY